MLFYFYAYFDSSFYLFCQQENDFYFYGDDLFFLNLKNVAYCHFPHVFFTRDGDRDVDVEVDSDEDSDLNSVEESDESSDEDNS